VRGHLVPLAWKENGCAVVHRVTHLNRASPSILHLTILPLLESQVSLFLRSPRVRISSFRASLAKAGLHTRPKRRRLFYM
jgi:hypothetical protein